MATPYRYRPALDRAVRTPLLVVGAVAAFAAVGVGMLVAGTSSAVAVDDPVQAAVSAVWPDPGEVAYAVDLVGDPRVVAVLTSLLLAACAVTRRWRAAAVTVVAVFAVGATATLAKPLTGRTIHGDNLSYPSGHVAMATVLVTVAVLAFLDLVGGGRTRHVFVFCGASVVAALMMSFDQIAIEAHYPTDAFGGACVAVALVPPIAAAVDALVERIRPRPSSDDGNAASATGESRGENLAAGTGPDQPPVHAE